MVAERSLTILASRGRLSPRLRYDEPMMRAIPSLLLLLALLMGCNSSFRGDAGTEVDASECICDACEDAIQLRVEGVSDPSLVTIDGLTIECQDSGTFVYCGVPDLPPGDYSLTVSAPGYMSQDVFFTLAAPVTVGCCTCPSTYSRLITLRPV